MSPLLVLNSEFRQGAVEHGLGFLMLSGFRQWLKFLPDGAHCRWVAPALLPSLNRGLNALDLALQSNFQLRLGLARVGVGPGANWGRTY